MKQIMVMGVPFEIIQLMPLDLLKLYEESLHADDIKKLFGEKCENFSGLCDAQASKIYLNIQLPPEKKRKTFIHEFVEAMDQECITDLSHIQMQAIANTFFLSGIVDIEELLKIEPEDLEISLAGNTA
jgi:hypothetical protein